MLFETVGTRELLVTFDDLREQWNDRHQINVARYLANNLPPPYDSRLSAPFAIPAEIDELTFDDLR